MSTQDTGPKGLGVQAEVENRVMANSSSGCSRSRMPVSTWQGSGNVHTNEAVRNPLACSAAESLPRVDAAYQQMSVGRLCMCGMQRLVPWPYQAVPRQPGSIPPTSLATSILVAVCSATQHEKNSSAMSYLLRAQCACQCTLSRACATTSPYLPSGLSCFHSPVIES